MTPGAGRTPRPLRRAAIATSAWLLVGATLAVAGCTNHYLIHPKRPPQTVRTWSEVRWLGSLRVRLEWAAPVGNGKYPAVLVHPEARHPASQMRGTLYALALRGYLAVAADYHRRGGSDTFAWRGPSDVRAALDFLRADPRADPRRIGAMGYSQGGVYSLLIAEHTNDVSAVVAYYPVTDFERWLHEPEGSWPRRLVFRFMRFALRRRMGVRNDEEFRESLRRASPLRHAESIRAPVLLIHGERDRTASVEESKRLEMRLRELGREVQLLVVPDAGHVFNFRDRQKAALAWEATLEWLDRHLRGQAPRISAAVSSPR